MVSTGYRGGTLQSLHISEFGKICRQFPDKATEIVTGAFEAVAKENTITIESTAEGREGYFYDYCTELRIVKRGVINLARLTTSRTFIPGGCVKNIRLILMSLYQATYNLILNG